MPAVDVYAITDKLDNTLLQILAARLEARGQHPRFSGHAYRISQRHEYRRGPYYSRSRVLHPRSSASNRSAQSIHWQNHWHRPQTITRARPKENPTMKH